MTVVAGRSPAYPRGTVQDFIPELLNELNRLAEAEDWLNRILHADGLAPVERNRYQLDLAASKIQQGKGNPSARVWNNSASFSILSFFNDVRAPASSV